MWKVKRMNTARIVVLTIAVGAGGVAACLAIGSDSKPPSAEPVAQLQTVDVLVAMSNIGLGQTQREKNPDRSNSTDLVVSEVNPTNIGVLAIDQAPKEEDGQNSVVSRTVTLESEDRSRRHGSINLVQRHQPDHDTEVTKRT